MIKRGTLDKPFKGIIDCGQWIIRNEGVMAFWRSNFTNCIRYFPTQALNFAFKGECSQETSVSLRVPSSHILSIVMNNVFSHV